MKSVHEKIKADEAAKGTEKIIIKIFLKWIAGEKRLKSFMKKSFAITKALENKERTDELNLKDCKTWKCGWG